MFARLKEKISESKIAALAESVISPTSSSVVEPTSASLDDHFGIDEGWEGIPPSTPSKSGFSSVDLGLREGLSPRASGSKSRRSSTSSVLSDTSAVHHARDSVGNVFHLQSDLESASELDESLGSQQLTNDQLLIVLTKTRRGYNKYKGRYADLVRHYREMERENAKTKRVLAESQDRSLRREAELKEQCLLEQRAKAHLEEILRNDLEEKDHVITTLNTKIQLLKSQEKTNEDRIDDANLETSPATFDGNTSLDIQPNLVVEDALVDLSGVSNQNKDNLMDQQNPDELISITKQRFEELESFEIKLHVYQEETNTTAKENEMHGNRLTAYMVESSSQIEALLAELNAARSEISTLQKQEEESSLLLAETKQTLHSELEIKEEEIKHLRETIGGAYVVKRELTHESSHIKLDSSEVQHSQDDIASVVELPLSESQSRTSESKTDLLLKVLQLETEIQEMKNIKEQLQNHNAELQKKCEVDDSTIVEMQQKAAEFIETCTQLTMEVATLKKHLAEVTAKAEGINNVNIKLHTDIELVRESISGVDGLNDQLIRAKDNLSEKSHLIDALQSKLLLLSEEKQHLVKCNEEFLNDRAAIETTLLQVQTHLEQQQATSTHWEEDCNRAHEMLSLKDAEIARIKETYSMVAKNKAELESAYTSILAKQANQLLESKLEFRHATGSLNRQLLQATLDVCEVGFEKHLLEEENDKLMQNIAILHSTSDTLQIEFSQRVDEVDQTQLEVNNLVRSPQEGMQSNATLVANFETLTASKREAETNLLIAQTECLDLAKMVGEKELVIRELRGELAVKFHEFQTYLNESNEKNNTLSEQLSKFDKEKRELCAQIAAKSKESAETGKQLGKLQKVIDDLNQKMSKTGNENKDLQRRIETLTEAQSTSEMERIYLSEQIVHVSRTNTCLSDSLATKTKEWEEASKKIAELQQVLDDVNQRESGTSDIVKEELHGQVVNLTNVLSEQYDAIVQLRKQVSHYTEEKAELRIQLAAKFNELMEAGEVVRELQQMLGDGNNRIYQTDNLNKELQKQVAALTDEQRKRIGREDELSGRLLTFTEQKQVLSMQLSARTNELTEAGKQVTQLQKVLDDLRGQMSDASNMNKELQQQVVTLTELQTKTKERRDELTEQVLTFNEEKHELSTQLAAKTSELIELQQALHDVNHQMSATVNENKELQQQLVPLTELQSEKKNGTDNANKLQEMNDANKRLKDELENITESKVLLTIEVKKLKKLNSDLKKEFSELGKNNAETYGVSRNADRDMARLMEDLENVNSEKKHLQLQLLESKVAQEKLENDLLNVNELHRLKIKQLVMDFQTQLSQKIDEITAVQEEALDLIASEEGSQLMRLRKQIKALQLANQKAEKNVKDLHIINNDALQVKDLEINALKEELKEAAAKHQAELRENIKKWRLHLDRDIELLKAAHKEEISALSQEWQWERKASNDSKPIQSVCVQELESTSQVAVAAVESGTETMEMLHRQLVLQQQQMEETKKQYMSELAALQQLVSTHNEGEDPTKMEYLRNILYEYMMGHQTDTLARVLADLVKFDQEKTFNVLQKMEQKQGLLSQLGLL